MLLAAGIEVLVAGIKGQREQALWPPLERMLAAVARFHGGAAVARQHIDHFLEHMLLRGSLRPGLEVEHEDRDEVAATLEVDDAALDAEAGPMSGRALQEVDAEVLGHRHAFLLGPGDVGVEQELRMFGQRLVHCWPPHSGLSRHDT
jgi:hypothetical protein